jgi:hypothetical protein
MAMPLQYRWDVFLLTRFYQNIDQPMFWLIVDFKKRYGIDDETFATLIRIPNTRTMLRRPCGAFLGIHLKTLADLCWKKSLEDVFDIAEKLKTSALDVCEKRLSTDREIKQSRRDYRIAMLEYSAYIDHKTKTNRANWHACKP